MNNQMNLRPVAIVLAFALITGAGSQALLNHAFGETSNQKQMQALMNKTKGETQTGLKETRKMAQDTVIQTRAKTLQHEAMTKKDKMEQLKIKPQTAAIELKQINQQREKIRENSDAKVANSDKLGAKEAAASHAAQYAAIKKNAEISKSKAEQLKMYTQSKLGETRKMAQETTVKTRDANKAAKAVNWETGMDHAAKETQSSLKHG